MTDMTTKKGGEFHFIRARLFMGLIIQQPRPIGILLSLVHILLCLSKNKIAALWTDIATIQKQNSETLAILFSFGSIHLWLVLSKIECSVHVVLPKQSIILLRPVQQTRQQVLIAYCPLYILWLDIAASDIQTQNICLVETRSTKVTLSELILLEVAELSSHKSIMARHYSYRKQPLTHFYSALHMVKLVRDTDPFR